MKIKAIDHIVLTVASIADTVEFYTAVLDMELEKFVGNGVERIALRFGDQKINLHEKGREFTPGARVAIPGTGDLCFLCDGEIGEMIARIETRGVTIEEGPVSRTGAVGKLMSVYIRDPDGNLIEIAEQIS